MMRHGAVMCRDSRLLQKVRSFFVTQGLDVRHDSIVVACSGGPDSLTLLDVLSQLQTEWNMSVTACYIHHGIRKAADQEVLMVQEEARKRGCSFITYRVDVPALAKKRHQSVETVGRDERYRLLRKAKERVKAHYIAVAHHADDQAETVLAHLLRGTGLSGLCGMEPCHSDIIRPFLFVTRRDIEDYVQRHSLQPAIDETNGSRKYGRNRIRLDLIPALMTYNPNIVSDLNRLAAIVQRDESYLNQETEQVVQRLMQRSGSAYIVQRKELMALHPAIMRRVLRRIAGCFMRPGGTLSFAHTETLCHMVTSEKETTFTMTGFTVCTDREYMHFMAAPEAVDAFEMPAPIVITGTGTYSFGNSVLTVTSLDMLPDKAEWGTLYISASYIQKGLVLRCRQPGDCIHTHGGTKSLKKYFNELKIPPVERYRRPLLCCGHDILLMEGVAPAVTTVGDSDQMVIACHF